jgi:integrase
VERGYAGTYIRLIRHVVRLAFDHADVDPNPARHRLVKLPPDLREPVDPPTAAEIEAAFYKLEKRFRLPFLALESSGGRIRAVVNKSKKDNFDPATGLLLSRRTEMKKRVAHFNNLHPAVSRALEHHVAALPLECERLFPDIDSHSLREAIRKACKEAGVRHIKPHDLRHRRISLLHAQGKTWAEIGARVAQSSFSTTEKTYTHLMLETRELDYERLVRDC